MKKPIILITILFQFFLFGSVLSAQSKLFVSGFGGINYIPMKEFSHSLNQFSNAESDKIAFSGNIKLQLRISESDNIFLSSEYISNNASFSGGWVSMIWNFESIPITIGYEYTFENFGMSWSPYLGVGISYLFQNSEMKYMGDDGSLVTNNSSDALGFETHFGIEKNIIENLSLVSEIKYRYFADLKVRKFSKIEEANLSGIVFQLGIRFQLL